MGCLEYQAVRFKGVHSLLLPGRFGFRWENLKYIDS